MSGEVVNLRTARKARKRAEDEHAAAESRARFGRSKAERTAATAEAGRQARMLDGANASRKDEPRPGAACRPRPAPVAETQG